jgi:hypothetical protein
MSRENNESLKEQSTESKSVESVKTLSDISEPKPRISEDIKKLLNSLLHKTLDKRLKRLENRHLEQKKNAELTTKSFKHYISQLDSLVKNMEETLKKKEAKKKEETPRRLKVTPKKPLSSKSVPPNKRARMSRPDNNNASKILEKKKLNLTTFKTENNSKEKQNRAKSMREKRMLSESNLKKGKIKIKKLDNSSIATINKDDKKDDIKAKTLSNYHTERKIEGKRNINNLLKSKTRDKDKKSQIHDELSKSVSEHYLSEKNKKKKEKSDKSKKKKKKKE